MDYLSYKREGSFNCEYFTSIQWEGKSYNPSVEYEQRPWEIEAFAKSNELEKSLNNELYK